MDLKKVGIVISVIVAVLSVIIALTLWRVGMPKLWQQYETDEEEEILITNLDELLPLREDIPTKWQTGSSSNVTLDESGFVEGKMESYHYSSGDLFTVEHGVEFYLYRFSNVNSAEAYCDKKINEIKSEGGYREVTIWRARDVFAVVYESKFFYEEEKGFSWGIISNVVFNVYVYERTLNSANVDDELKDFTVIVKNRIADAVS